MLQLSIYIALLVFFIVPTHIFAQRPPQIRGIALGHYTDIEPAKLEQKLEEIKSLGANYVSLIVAWSTNDVRSTKITPRKNFATPTSVLAHMVVRAKAHGLKVLLFPIIDLQRRKPLEWRGTITPANWDEWWQSYQHYILHFANFAQKTKVDMFSIGSELVSTETMFEKWSDLIARVRKIFCGRIIYSANWDHYRPVLFWKLVDEIGLTAYYGLSKNTNAHESEMFESWKSARDELVAWIKEIGRPVIFTEVGYPSLDGGAVNPWDYTQRTPVDLEEQKRAYIAFTKAWGNVPELRGIFFWDWYGEGGPKDKNYTPRNKPASDVIKSWFTATNKK